MRIVTTVTAVTAAAAAGKKQKGANDCHKQYKRMWSFHWYLLLCNTPG
jgi:hypothetical protein